MKRHILAHNMAYTVILCSLLMSCDFLTPSFAKNLNNPYDTSAASSPGPSSSPGSNVSAPGTPTGVIASGGDARIVVTWVIVNGSTSYKVFYKAGATATIADAQATSTMLNGTTATITGLTPGSVQYSFVVMACNAAGNSAPSTVVSASTADFAIGGTGQAGGLIFYDKGSYSGSPSWRYLEASRTNQSLGIDWGTTSAGISTDTALGTGKANTDAIVTAFGIGSYAAKLCKDLTLGGYNDWFLPSKNEIDAINSNLPSIGYADYWSSSQYDSSRAWSVYNGVWSYSGITYLYFVRAVRSF